VQNSIRAKIRINLRADIPTKKMSPKSGNAPIKKYQLLCVTTFPPHSAVEKGLCPMPPTQNPIQPQNTLQPNTSINPALQNRTFLHISHLAHTQLKRPIPDPIYRHAGTFRHRQNKLLQLAPNNANLQVLLRLARQNRRLRNTRPPRQAVSIHRHCVPKNSPLGLLSRGTFLYREKA